MEYDLRQYPCVCVAVSISSPRLLTVATQLTAQRQPYVSLMHSTLSYSSTTSTDVNEATTASVECCGVIPVSITMGATALGVLR